MCIEVNQKFSTEFRSSVVGFYFFIFFSFYGFVVLILHLTERTVLHTNRTITQCSDTPHLACSGLARPSSKSGKNSQSDRKLDPDFLQCSSLSRCLVE